MGHGTLNAAANTIVPASVIANGDVVVNPQPPTFAKHIELRRLKLRGHALDIVVDGRQYEVRDGDRTIQSAVGEPVVIRGK